MGRVPADANDFEPGSDERIEAALAGAGTTDPVDSYIADWGEFDQDHTKDDSMMAWEHTEIDEPYFDGAEIYTVTWKEEQE